MSESERNGGSIGKRERSPSFPYLDLDACLDLLSKMYSQAKMNEVRQTDVADLWEMAPKSGSLMRYVAALGQYGLVETSGSGDQKRIKVSTDGRRVLEDDRPGVREKLRSEAALKSNIIRSLYYGENKMPCWGADRPSDARAESSLKFDLGFGGEAARRFLTVYDATTKRIIDESADKEVVATSGSEALESEQSDPETVETMQPQPQSSSPPPSPKADLALNDIDFQSAGKGKIRISATLDADGLEALEKKIAAFKLLLN